MGAPQNSLFLFFCFYKKHFKRHLLKFTAPWKTKKNYNNNKVTWSGVTKVELKLDLIFKNRPIFKLQFRPKQLMLQ